MNSLSSGLVADVLARLHREAEAADSPLMQTVMNKGREEILGEFLQAETRDVAAVYRELAGNFLSVSPVFGRFLYMCVRACKPTCIVEFGSSMGVSTIYLAAALRDMGGGRVIGTDLELGKVERARANVAAAGLAEFVEFRVGDARKTLEGGVGSNIDMVVLDGAFTLYLSVLKVLEPHLKPGALIVGENAFEEAPGYIDYVRDPRNGYLSLPLPFETGRGNEFTIRTS